MPIPSFYYDKDSIKAITWYRNTQESLEMFNKRSFYKRIAFKYNIRLYISEAISDPGKIVYGDIFQVGIINPVNDSKIISSTEYIKNV